MRRWDFYDAKQKEREGGGRKDKRRKALSEKLAKKKSRGCAEKQKCFDRSQSYSLESLSLDVRSK